MFFKQDFLFYLPKRHYYYIIKAKDESEAVWKLMQQFQHIEEQTDNYTIIKNCRRIK